MILGCTRGKRGSGCGAGTPFRLGSSFWGSRTALAWRVGMPCENQPCKSKAGNRLKYETHPDGGRENYCARPAKHVSAPALLAKMDRPRDGAADAWAWKIVGRERSPRKSAAFLNAGSCSIGGLTVAAAGISRSANITSINDADHQRNRCGRVQIGSGAGLNISGVSISRLSISGRSIWKRFLLRHGCASALQSSCA